MTGKNNNEFDVIVIGGGITGAGTARDCSLRGLRTLSVMISLTVPQEGITDFSIAVHAMRLQIRSLRQSVFRKI